MNHTTSPNVQPSDPVYDPDILTYTNMHSLINSNDNANQDKTGSEDSDVNGA